VHGPVRVEGDCDRVPESPCKTGFTCGIPTVVGPFCCQKFCICKDYVVVPDAGMAVPSACDPDVAANTCCNLEGRAGTGTLPVGAAGRAGGGAESEVTFGAGSAPVDQTTADKGKAGEDRAVVVLRAAAFVIVERNYRCPLGEIDVIARDGEVLVLWRSAPRPRRSWQRAGDRVAGQAAPDRPGRQPLPRGPEAGRAAHALRRGRDHRRGRGFTSATRFRT